LPPRDDRRKTRGQDGSLLLSCRALSSPTTCRFIPALGRPQVSEEYLYGYNAAGELSTVTYPSIATAAQYFYDTGHLLRETKTRAA
ncbi:MAG: hypothetical protein ACKV22_00540, partial [Bryobacteraceae bacterium]